MGGPDVLVPEGQDIADWMRLVEGKQLLMPEEQARVVVLAIIQDKGSALPVPEVAKLAKRKRNRITERSARQAVQDLLEAGKLELDSDLKVRAAS